MQQESPLMAGSRQALIDELKKENARLKRENEQLKIAAEAQRRMSEHINATAIDKLSMRVLYEDRDKLAVVDRGVFLTMAMHACRWLGFLGSQRIRILGSAGIHEGETQGRLYDQDFVHVGCELWTQYSAPELIDPVKAEELKARLVKDNAYGRLVFERYADAAYMNLLETEHPGSTNKRDTSVA